jgi:hypothetical protein
MIPLIVVSVLSWIFTGSALIAASIAVIGLVWICLRTHEGPPVLALALTLQWISVTVGVFYVYVTGRPLQATLSSNYEPMVFIGLGCILALLFGLCAGRWLIGLVKPPAGVRPDQAFSPRMLAVSYLAAAAAVGAVQQAAWQFPSITQAIIAITYLRLALLYLLLRQLVRLGRWEAVAGILAFEVALGLTGFYAGFREPLVMAVLALLEVFDRRSVRQWAAIGALATVMGALGVMWISVRTNYRERVLDDANFAASRSERLQSIRSAADAWFSQDQGALTRNLDKFIDRLWAIYYPALAVARVPDTLPHTDGQLMMDTLSHIVQPRIFFPDKPELTSDSELVRKYAGVWVAGEEQGTTIAFGYAAESYVDYGIPIMFVPVFVYGLFMGLVYEGILRLFRHRDIAIGVATVICWLSLYLFERSWVKTIGLAGTLIVYVGVLTLLFDRVWFAHSRSALEPRAEAAHEAPPAIEPGWP